MRRLHVVAAVLAGSVAALATSFTGPLMVYGPADFVRSTASPTAVRATFASGSVGGGFTLCLRNGGEPERFAPVTSATVSLNGRELFTQNHFKQSVAFLSRVVELRTSNELIVRVSGKPGSGVTIWVVKGFDCSGGGVQNRPPVITSIPPAAALLLEPYRYVMAASDPDADALTFTLSTAPTGMAIDPATGVIEWTPPGTGTLPVSVRVTDGRGGSAVQDFDLTVGQRGNRPPVLVPVGDRTIAAGERFHVAVAADDPDAHDVLVLSMPSGPAGAAFANGRFIDWTPAVADIGTHAFSIGVVDSYGATDTESFTVTVVPVNLPPTLSQPPDLSLMAGVPFAGTLAATDPNLADSLTFSLLQGPSGMTVQVHGGISWTPQMSQLGTHNITIAVTDSGGLTDEAIFTAMVDVAGGVLAPTARDDRYAVRRGSTITVPSAGVLGNDTDPTQRPLTSVLLSSPSRGSLTFGGDGSFAYTPNMPAANSTLPALAFELRRPQVDVTGVDSNIVVADLDRDGRPEIISHGSGAFTSRWLDAVRGDGSVLFSTDAYVSGQIEITDGIAVGDLDGDGPLEIVTISSHNGLRRHLVAFNSNGTTRWTSDNLLDGISITSTGGAHEPVLADLNGDGTPEILVQHRASGPAPNNSSQDYVTAFSNTGRILWHCRGGDNVQSSGRGLVVSDINLDGKPEILFSNDACDHQGNPLWTIVLPSGLLFLDVAVGNLDTDPFAEIVYTDNSRRLHVYEHTGAKKWGPIAPASSADISRPVIADVDGDGRSEILAGLENHLAIVQADASFRLITLPFPGWGGTPTVFDLNGDGKPEILYQGAHGPDDGGVDPQFGSLYVFDGTTGALLHSLPADRHSANAADGVIVADVDGDGSAAIVTPSWAEDFVTIRVFKAAGGKWMPSRPIWNQIGYHVTNINPDGSIPKLEPANWLTPGMNNFAVNVPLPSERVGQDADVFMYRASNGLLQSPAATVFLDILPPNRAPRILSIAPNAAAHGVEYLYQVRAVDADPGEILTFTLLQAPPGMTIDSATGLVRWTPAAGQTGRVLAAVHVSDTQNESDSQQIVVTIGPPVVVPDVAGVTIAAAEATLTGAGLVAGVPLMVPSSTVPAGSVISQSPAAATLAAAGSLVALVVSSGPQPVNMPYVVGTTETAARGLLSGLGFTVASMRSFSNTVPTGRVISQDVAAGTSVVPGAVTVVVSAGRGLTLRPDRTITPADQPIAFAVVATDVNGNVLPAPAVNLTVGAAKLPFVGALPAVSGSMVVPAAATRGLFRLTATDPATGQTTGFTFAVGPPGTSPGQPGSFENYAQLSDAMGDINELVARAGAASLANDVPLMRSILNQMVQRWRQVNRGALRFDSPFVLSAGFMPRPSDVSALGLSSSAGDRLALKAYRAAAIALQAWTDGLRAPATSLAQLSALGAAFRAKVAALGHLNTTEWFAIRAQGLLTASLSNRIPAFYDALMDELEQVVINGVPEPMVSGPSIADESTLSEQLVKLAVEHIVEEIVEQLDESFGGFMKYRDELVGQAVWGGAAITVAQHVRAATHGRDLTATIAGASMSFRQFYSPNSIIEGDIDTEDPAQNVVVLIGPDITQAIRDDIVDIRQLILAGHFTNAGMAIGRLKALYDNIQQKHAQGLGPEYGRAFQNGTQAFRGCLFSSAENCGALIFPDGFSSVYEYSPPGAFGQCFTGFPVPIIVMVYNKTTTELLFDFPPFFPTHTSTGQPFSGCRGQ